MDYAHELSWNRWLMHVKASTDFWVKYMLDGVQEGDWGKIAKAHSQMAMNDTMTDSLRSSNSRFLQHALIKAHWPLVQDQVLQTYLFA